MPRNRRFAWFNPVLRCIDGPLRVTIPRCWEGANKGTGWHPSFRAVPPNGPTSRCSWRRREVFLLLVRLSLREQVAVAFAGWLGPRISEAFCCAPDGRGATGWQAKTSGSVPPGCCRLGSTPPPLRWRFSHENGLGSPATVVAPQVFLAACPQLAADRQQSAAGRFRKARKLLKDLAPQVGLEPTTLRLTAGCSAIELLRIAGRPS